MEKTNLQDEANVLDLVTNDSRFTRFGEAIKAAGLAEKFSNAEDLTLFVPTNGAFAKLPHNKADDLMKTENRVQLQRLVLLHVYSGKLLAEDLKELNALRMEAGQEIKVSVSPDLKDISLANAKVMLPKAEAKNGVVYALDSVLQPASSASAAA